MQISLNTFFYLLKLVMDFICKKFYIQLDNRIICNELDVKNILDFKFKNTCRQTAQLTNS